ncbi:MAG: response regulator [Pseudomonadota bacterium]
MADTVDRQVLVADSEPRSRRVLAEILARGGHGVSEAYDGWQALELCRTRSFSLVFANLSTPRAGGLELLKEMQARFPRTPVVVFSENADVATALEAMKNGAFDFLLKPLSVELIEEVTMRALRQISRDREAEGKVQRPIITCDTAMQKLMGLARSVAPSKATVLISGSRVPARRYSRATSTP